MTLQDGKAITLFRFHTDFAVAHERVRLLQHYNPDIEILALYGGDPGDFGAAQDAMRDFTAKVWLYPGDRTPDWKWRHTDLMLKAWYRQVGKWLSFDFLFSYEYDLLTLAPLLELYPNINDNTVALGACTTFTPEIEQRWHWTTHEPERTNFLQFCDYLQRNYGIARQQKVSLGPGPLLPKKFLDKWSTTQDLELVHDELAYPAYAEALGFAMVDHGMHPGWGNRPDEKYFNCEDWPVTPDMIAEQMAIPHGRRAFHPVKAQISLEDIQAEL